MNPSVFRITFPDDISPVHQFTELILEDFSREEMELFLSMIDRICDSVRRRVDSYNDNKKEGKGE